MTYKKQHKRNTAAFNIPRKIRHQTLTLKSNMKSKTHNANTGFAKQLTAYRQIQMRENAREDLDSFELYTPGSIHKSNEFGNNAKITHTPYTRSSTGHNVKTSSKSMVRWWMLTTWAPELANKFTKHSNQVVKPTLANVKISSLELVNNGGLLDHYALKHLNNGGILDASDLNKRPGKTTATKKASHEDAWINDCRASVNALRAMTCEDLINLEFSPQSNYPCLLFTLSPVFIEKHEDIQTELNDDGSLMTFLMHVLVGLINKELSIANLFENDIPIAERSSFGHIDTTIADCYQYLRINPGYVDYNYLVAIAKGIMRLDELLLHITLEINYFYKDFRSPLGHKRNSVFNEFVRTEKDKLNISHFAFNNSTDDSMLNDLITNCFRRFKDFSVEHAALRETHLNSPIKQKQNPKLYKQLTEIKRVAKGDIPILELNHGSRPRPRHYYRELEKRVSLIDEAIDGLDEDTKILPLSYGSDSDTDRDDIFSHKFIVASCMNAFATLNDPKLNKFFNRSKDNVTSKNRRNLRDFVYYEYSNSYIPKFSSDTLDEQRVVIDINPVINARSNKSIFSDHVAHHILPKDMMLLGDVFDCTTSTQIEMANILATRLRYEHELTCFVRSVTKFGINGYDICPYGEIRLFSTNRILLNEMIQTIYDSGVAIPSSETVHKIRRHVKSTLGTMSNNKIISLVHQVI